MANNGNNDRILITHKNDHITWQKQMGQFKKKWWLIHGPENGTIMLSTLMDDMAEKHNGMFGQVAKEIN